MDRFKKRLLLKSLIKVSLCIGAGWLSGVAYGAGETGGSSLGSITSGLADTIHGLLNFFQYVMYAAAFGFIVGAAFHLKKYKDNPEQNSVGKPIIYFVVALMLLYVPTILDSLGTDAGLKKKGADKYNANL